MTSEQKQPKARVLAYYLPQFHPIPENDAWWGKGFTEWTNVGKAKPLFPGHYQPHVPADLGYYDLRVPETREAQAQMAREAGVEGFVYWHYWFGNGKRLLERPFNEVLASGKPDFPFALAWANESWSGTFHGLKEGNMLIEQTYPGDEDYIAHFNAVLPAFKDKRYITCEGKPIFVIYLASSMPDVKHFIHLWQKLAKNNGLNGIYFIAHEHHCYDHKLLKERINLRREQGFDAVNIVNIRQNETNKLPFWNRFFRWLFYKRLRLIPNLLAYDINSFVTPYDRMNNVFPSISPGWDNTPRTGKLGEVQYGATPEKFGQALRNAIDTVREKPVEQRFVFIKSWNEWAEGNYVEPDLKWGNAYIKTMSRIMRE